MANNLDQSRKFIIERMMAFPYLDQSRIQYPNAKLISVPTEGLWAAIYINWGGSIVASIGDAPCVRRTGIIQIRLMSRPETHEVQITQMADQLLQHFEFYRKENLELLQGSIQPLASSDFYEFMVTIGFRVN
ncbi:MAG: phage tail terminator-like protein [Pseudomonadota bacterium]